MKSFLSILSLLLLTACSMLVRQPVRPDALTFPKLTFDFPQVEHLTLANGIEVYLLPDHDLPLVEITTLTGGGSIFDPPEMTGLSDLFVESLQTGGAGDRSPLIFQETLENMAADLKVSSSSYAYQLDMSMRRQDVVSGFGLLADVLRRPQFDAQRIEIARLGLIEGVRRRNDDPASIAARTLARSIYGDHPFGRVARQKTLNAIRREDLLRLYQTYFQPSNLSIAVSGDIDLDELKTLLSQTFGDWQGTRRPSLKPPALPVKDQKGELFIADKDLPQTTIMMGQPGIDKNNPDAMALKVANYILGGGGFNSRMMREIRSNHGLTYSVYSYFQIGRLLPELFIAQCETKCSSTLEVVSMMRAQMQGLINMPVSDAELTTAKESLINSFVFAFDSSHAVVTRQQRLDFYEYPADYMQTYRQKIAAVTKADVQRVAKKYLHPDQLQIVLVGRRNGFEQDPAAALGMPVEKVDLGVE
ncbi:M16 family metallopeptidase [Geopsychrobacter electrodiphilus]|uniref:M16 family metallopeptidase n=1 Tax=Geopsychrobacter electrodiphilus TaxID=225196 RepID=UPI0003605CAC|nr:pitrilysin family protein [Geopsychrobacter electrodiphilus]